MIALKQIFISFIPPLLALFASAAIAYSSSLGVIAIAPDFTVFCAALALAIAVIFGAVLARSAIAHAALFAIAVFWLVIGGRMENAAFECAKALGFYILPIAAVVFAALKEPPFWSSAGILRLLCLSIALFFVVLLSLSPQAIGAAAALQYGFGDTFFGVPKGAAIVYALTWVFFLSRALSQTRKLAPIALGASCAAFLTGLVFAPDRALCALFFGAGAAILVVGSLPFSFAPRAIAAKNAREAKSPPLKAQKSQKAALKLPQFSLPKIAFSKERVVERAQSLFSPPKTQPLLAHPDLRFYELDDKVSVVLSPAYYWYKRSDAPFKTRRLAKRFAASVFFGWIPDGAYRYFAFKEAGGWGFIACDPAAVTQRLNEQGLDALQISRLYFAQSALDPEDSPIAISQTAALSFIDGSWVALPSKLAAAAKPFDRAPRVLRAPSFSPPRARESADLPRKRFWIAASFLALIIAALAVDIFRIGALTSACEREREAILTSAKLPATQLQLESIERRLNAIASTQRGLRETLGKLLTFAPAARLEKLDYEDRTIAVRFAPVETLNAQAIVDRLKVALPEAESRVRDDRVWAAVKW